MSSSQRTQLAVLVKKEGRELIERPVEAPSAGEVLIKNSFISSNPKDWKIPFYMNRAGIEGNDVAGYVEEVGEGVNEFKKGDKVAAFSKMRTADKYGAYQQYTHAPSNTTFHLGPHTKLEAAATFPLAYMTAAIGLFLRLGLPAPSFTPGRSTPTYPFTGHNGSLAILIYGASTTVGIFAIQLAKLAGFYVVGVAGASGDLARAYGADEIIDYRGKSPEDLTMEIRMSAQGMIRHAYDVVSENGSTEIIAKALAKEGGKITYTLTYSDEELARILPAGVTAERTLVGTAYAEDSAFAREWYTHAGELLEANKLRCMRYKIVPGGLRGVEEGLRRLKEGEVSGEKLLYRVEDTEGLKA